MEQKAGSICSIRMLWPNDKDSVLPQSAPFDVPVMRRLQFLLPFSFVTFAAATATLSTRVRYRENARPVSQHIDGDNRILAGVISEFMADSKMQLIIDMDLFWSLFADTPNRIHKTMQSGDESLFRELLGYVQQLKVLSGVCCSFEGKISSDACLKLRVVTLISCATV